MNARHRNIEAVGNHLIGELTGRVKLSGFPHDFLVEDGAMLGGSMRRPSLLSLIRHVVLFCAEKQMIGVYARRIIAFVKHKKIDGYRAVCKLVSDAVRPRLFLLPIERAIAFRAPGQPKPACISFLNIGPKLLRCRLLGRVIAIGRTVFTAPPFYLRQVSFKSSITGFANACYFSASQDVNLREQVSFWLGSLENSNSLEGRFVFYQSAGVVS